ncbi:GNAT family N-acetyltransferase [Halorussus marinus]|uniref:GNAT family N-acetyltransferase n=1 Tax=Halorussus marinus TaxID=2505976 RepID=UPI001091B43E|nr:GNAT family N-acetyltransferase [Halorussus marinus]
MSVAVRAATPDDGLGVRRVLDAAMLDVRADLPERIEAGDVLVAVGSGPDPGDSSADSRDADGPVVGALVAVPIESGARIDAVAVRRARRARGVGTALVRAAAADRSRLVAAFDPDVRPFYESLGFDVSPAGDGRLRGVWPPDCGSHPKR